MVKYETSTSCGSAVVYRFLPALLVMAGLLMPGVWLAGCGTKEVRRPDAAPPPPTYSGPAHMRGTISSLTYLHSADAEPIIVSNYGLVVLPSGSKTGSREVPAHLRQYMQNYAGRMGVGSARLGWQGLTPQRLLDDEDTALVEVMGLVPAGAVRGSRFDLLVRALPQTQTTSLAGGTLWTQDLAIGPPEVAVSLADYWARGYGSIYTNPFDEQTPEEEQLSFQRNAVVVSGGTVTRDRRLRLILNQPSWFRARAIADRINERFPAAPADRFPTADAKSDVLVELNIPRQYRQNPDRLIALVMSLHLRGGTNFEPAQADRLAQLLMDDPEIALDVVLMWEALGRTITPVLQRYYEHPRMHVQLAALEAGARLRDERAARQLSVLANHDDPQIRQQVAEALVFLPRSTRAEQSLRNLLDDDDVSVRVAAYESLAANGSAFIDRHPVANEHGVKFYIDRITASQKPLIYVTHDRFPRIVIFGHDVTFDAPAYGGAWDSRLIVLRDEPDDPLKLYFKPWSGEAKTYDLQPTLATLIYLMGHRPHAHDMQEGLNLTFGQVVDVLYQMCNRGDLEVPIEVRSSDMAQAIAQLNQQGQIQMRPEFEELLDGPAPEPEDPADDLLTIPDGGFGSR